MISRIVFKSGKEESRIINWIPGWWDARDSDRVCGPLLASAVCALRTNSIVLWIETAPRASVNQCRQVYST